MESGALRISEKHPGGSSRQNLSPAQDDRHGNHIECGSDGPCTLPDPVFGIHAACNHYIPEQSITIQEALKMFTYNAAWTTFYEKDRGSLEKGKIADMVVLNRNPLAMKPNELLSLKVERLLLNGTAYKKGQGIMSLLAKGIQSEGKI